jgi:FkbM family methyltransferase
MYFCVSFLYNFSLLILDARMTMFKKSHAGRRTTALDKIFLNLNDAVTFGPQFLRRHLARITSAQTVQVNIPGRQRIHIRVEEGDASTIRQIFRDDHYNIDSVGKVGERVWERYQAILRSGCTPIIVDAGANIGAASLWFLNKYPRAKVIAVEPEPSNLDVLLKNAENQQRLTVLPAAVGSCAGFATLEKENHGWATQTLRSSKGVRVITMDETFGLVSNGSPFIAKIDIEGFEDDLFRENLQWLDQVYCVFLEPHDWMLPGRMTSHNFQRAFAARHFEVFILGEVLAFVRI